MNNLDQELVAEFFSDMEFFFKRLDAELEYLQEDISLAKLNLSGGKACDFGCCLGFTTFSIASVQNFSEVIGVDKDANAISQAQLWIEAVKKHIQLTGETKKLEVDELENQACNLLKIQRPPKFRVGDIARGENLPSDIDFAYCRKILTPIALGEFENSISGQEGVKNTLENIAKSVKQRGWLLIIEKAMSSSIDFKSSFIQTGLELVSISSIRRKDILTDGNKGLSETSYLIYTLQKS